MRMGKLKVALAAAAALLGMQAAQAEVGRTPGTFDVSSSGAATYTIPIWVPRGPRDIQPAISLNYSSKDENGVMGVGWTLGGLSAIERCSKSAAQDGDFAEVTLTAQDRFCLDGARLRLTAGTTYGALNSTYQTEIADFSEVKLTAVGGANEPLSFEARTKSGLTFYYGTTDNSRVIAGGTTQPHRWKVEKVADRQGNSYTVEYNSPDPINMGGHRLPATIRWTRTNSTSTDYVYSMTFEYEVRATWDSSSGYVAGLQVWNNYRLKYIRVRNAGSTIRKYTLDFNTGSSSFLSRVASVTECADETGQHCVPATSMAYQAGPGVAAAYAFSTTTVGSLEGAADFNGDGKQDLVFIVNNQWKVLFGTNGNPGLAVDVPGLTLPNNAVEFDNFLPNGRAAFLANHGGTLWTYSATDLNGDGVFEFAGGVSTGILFSGVPRGVDWNGDGLSDLMWVSTTGTRQVRLITNVTPSANTSPFFGGEAGGRLIPTSTGDGGTIVGASVQTGRNNDHLDANGDGREDVYLSMSVNYGPSGTSYSALLLGGWTLAAYPWPNALNLNKTIGRFNDDACDDIFIGTVQISKCNSSPTQTVGLPAGLAAADVKAWADWNGDGRKDLITNNSATVSVAIYPSIGNGFGPMITTSIQSGTYTPADLDGDGAADLARVNSTNIRIFTRANPGGGGTTLYLTHYPDLLASVTDGYGVTTYADYVSTAQNNYLEGADPVTPLAKTDLMIVVGRARISDGIGGAFSKSYTYTGARRDTSRKSFAGFEQIDVLDSRTQFVTRTYYDQTFPKAGMVSKREVLQSSGRPVSRVTFTNAPQELSNNSANNQRYFQFVSRIVAQDFDLPGPVEATALTTEQTDFTNVDYQYGNVRAITKAVTDGGSAQESPDSGRTITTSITNTFEPVDTGTWCVGYVRNLQVLKSAPGETSISQSTEFTPEGTLCRPASATLQGSYPVVTNIRYDAFGNVDRLSVVGRTPDGIDMQPRVTETDWDVTGTYAEYIQNPLNQRTHFSYDFDLGVIESTTDANTLTTTWHHDSFGRTTKVIGPDGTGTRWTYADCGSQCFGTQHKLTVTRTQLNDGEIDRTTDQISYLDRFERPIVVRSKLLAGNEQWIETQYDNRGRLTKESLPCELVSATTSCASGWLDFTYDVLSRITERRRPASAGMSGSPTETFAYTGRNTMITDPEQNSRTLASGIQGKLRRSIDANGYAQEFEYDLNGNLVTVRHGTNALFSAEYVHGIGEFQSRQFRPASGAVNSIYNSLGERVEWTDAKETTFYADYDLLSRMTALREGDNTNEYEWGADPLARNVGQLVRTESSLGGEYEEHTFYDEVGRPRQWDIRIPGITDPFSYNFTYNADTGLPQTIQYPTSASNYRLTLTYGYVNDYLNWIGNQDGDTVWNLDAMSIRRQVSREYIGVGIHSATGIDRRQIFEPITGQLDTLMTGVAGNATTYQHLRYLYDKVGNLTQRQNDKALITEDFHYGGYLQADELYRLGHSTLTGSPNPGNNLEQTYDAIGNILTKNEPGVPDATMGYDVTWSNASYPTRIDATGMSFAFSYGPNRQKWKTVYTAGSAVETTHSIGGLMERVVKSDGTISFRHYIQANGDPIALYTRTGPTDESWQFMLSDHQGSVETIAGVGAAAPVHMSFSAYGERRNAAAWNGPLSAAEHATLNSITRHGFTYHEALGALGLNHMGGRIQDAVTGRFLSPDPIISDPTNSQDFNLYSYVYNNPLSYVDPTGLEEGCDDRKRSTLCLLDLFLGDPLEGFDFSIFWFDRGPPNENATGDGPVSSTSGDAKDSTVSIVKPSGTDQVCQSVGQYTCVYMSRDLATVIARQQGVMAVAGAGTVGIMVTGEVPILAFGLRTSLAVHSLSEGLPPGGTVAKVGGAGVAGTRATLASSIEAGLVRPGGKLAEVLGNIERGYAGAQPKTMMDAAGVIRTATSQAGLDVGVTKLAADGSIVLTNAGGVLTTVGTNGSIVVTRGADVLLSLGL
jgi:RHS repeat-associated protein